MKTYGDGFREGWEAGYRQAKSEYYIKPYYPYNPYPMYPLIWTSNSGWTPSADEAEGVKDVLTTVIKVLEPKGLFKWLETPIPALDNRTPYDIIQHGSLAELKKYVDSYLDSSFS